MSDTSEAARRIDRDRMYPSLGHFLLINPWAHHQYTVTVLTESLVVRFLVAACMAHVPQFRPNMLELEQTILAKVDCDWTDLETDPEHKFSIRDLLGEPGP